MAHPTRKSRSVRAADCRRLLSRCRCRTGLGAQGAAPRIRERARRRDSVLKTVGRLPRAASPLKGVTTTRSGVMLSLRTMLKSLGGEIGRSRSGLEELRCPGPGHSANDRSMCVKIDRTGEDFTVCSFASDDWQTCKDYVRERCGIAAWKP